MFMTIVYLTVIAGLIGTAVGYMAPSIIAFRKDHEHRWLILLANVFSGWKGVAWFPLLLWACRVIGGPGLERPRLQEIAVKHVRRPVASTPEVRRVDLPARDMPRDTRSIPGRQAERPMRIRPHSGW
jgi:hypothetical protein